MIRKTSRRIAKSSKSSKKISYSRRKALKFRAKIAIEYADETESGNTQIVITELPPDVKKAGENGIVKKIYDICLDDNYTDKSVFMIES